MSDTTWSSVEEYFESRLLPSDPVLEAALEASVAAGLPSIQVSASQGKLLHLLALAHGSRRILEVGTLGG
jgi:predicted O-methyltransferase YrrM